MFSNWCSDNCIAVSPKKSNFMSFNSSNVTIKMLVYPFRHQITLEMLKWVKRIVK